jgi:hypothetical protein
LSDNLPPSHEPSIDPNQSHHYPAHFSVSKIEDLLLSTLIKRQNHCSRSIDKGDEYPDFSGKSSEIIDVLLKSISKHGT